MPGRSQRCGARVVDDAGVEVHVQPGRLVLELPLGKRRRALRLVELGQLADQRVEQPPVLGTERVPAASVVRRVAGERGRDLRVIHLKWIGGHHPHPRDARGQDGGGGHHVVDHDQVRAHVVPDLHHPVVRVPRAAGELVDDRQRDRLELLDRGLAELGRGHPDELEPALAGLLLVLRRRPHSNQRLLEAALLELSLERLLDHEDDPDAALAQVVAQRHEVVGRSPGAGLWEHGDGGLLGHLLPLLVINSASHDRC